MWYLNAFLVGAIVGGVVMVYVYRNNPEKARKLADQAEALAREAAKKVK